MNTLSRDQYQSIFNITVDSLAAQLGLSHSDEPENPEELPEEFRSRHLKRQLAILQRESRPAQEKVHSEFAAKYLPALIEKYRGNTGALNSSVTMLGVISHSPYFVRFLRTPAGQGLSALQAHRIAQSPDHLDVESIGEICQFFSTLLLLQGISDIAEADKTTLLSKLRNWKTFRGTFASEASERCLALITEDPSARMMTQTVKEMLEKSLVTCGAQECTRRLQANGSPLMKCGRCKTAVYCGPKHQKQAWPSHKASCFAPTF